VSIVGLHLPQGVVTYALPVEVFVTVIKNHLDHLILRKFKGQNVTMPPQYLRKCVDRLILVAQNSSLSLDQLQKRMFISWFHFDPGHKCFYRQCVYV